MGDAPFYDHGILCNMAAFKEYFALILWEAKLMEYKKGTLASGGTSSLGHFDKLKSLADLPSDRGPGRLSPAGNETEPGQGMEAGPAPDPPRNGDGRGRRPVVRTPNG